MLQTIRRLLIRSGGFRLERELPGGICTHDINAPSQGTQWNYIDQLLEPIRTGKYAAVAATSDAFASYEKRRIAAAKTTIWGSGCTSWYLDSEGVPSSWPWTYSRFAEEMTKPKLEHFSYR